jgi:hypothetical protein
MYVCPSVRLSGCQSAWNNSVLTVRVISRWIILRIRNVWNKTWENQNTHFIFSKCFWKIVPFTSKKYGARDATNENIIRRMRFACWISKATTSTRSQQCTHPYTHTHTEICNYCVSTATMVSWKRLNITLYIHCLYCCKNRTVFCNKSCVSFNYFWNNYVTITTKHKI